MNPIKRIDELKKIINENNFKYYVLDSPVLSDSDYDQLLRELETLEGNNKDFITIDSPTQRVGAKPNSKFGLIDHQLPMLSLANAMNSDELSAFNKRIKKGLNKYILSITEKGYGKRTSFLDYRVTNRGGKGIIGIINSPRNGNISSSLIVGEEDEIILSTDKGSIMRCAVKEIRTAGRNTQGVRIKKLSGSEKVVSVIKIEDNIQ